MRAFGCRYFKQQGQLRLPEYIAVTTSTSPGQSWCGYATGWSLNYKNVVFVLSVKGPFPAITAKHTKQYKIIKPVSITSKVSVIVLKSTLTLVHHSVLTGTVYWLLCCVYKCNIHINSWNMYSLVV